MSRLTPEQVDSIEPSCDIVDPEDGTGRNCSNFYRHLYFAHYTLGEDWLMAFQIAARFQRIPLSVPTMHVIAADW